MKGKKLKITRYWQPKERQYMYKRDAQRNFNEDHKHIFFLLQKVGHFFRESSVNNFRIVNAGMSTLT